MANIPVNFGGIVLQAGQSATGSLVSINLDSASFATTGSNIFIGNQIVTGSISVTNSVTASYFVGIIDGGTF